MFSSLEPLFKKTFRQAESTDTRQAIRRDEKQREERKRKENQKDEQQTDLWTDKTSVSIEALKAFLKEFLKNQILKEKKEYNSVSAPKRSKNYGNHATNAYETASKYSENSFKKQNDESTYEGSQNINSEEARSINKLIDNLNTLSEKGLKELEIQKKQTFLDSLEDAVQKALKNF